MDEPIWLGRDVLDHMHSQLIREHGGSYGTRDAVLLGSALARPRTTREQEPATDLPAVAAAYAFGLAKSQGYVDGNKRVAFMATYSFLDANGLRLTASEDEAYAVVVDLASGDLSEEDLTRWLRASVEPVEG